MTEPTPTLVDNFTVTIPLTPDFTVTGVMGRDPTGETITSLWSRPRRVRGAAVFDTAQQAGLPFLFSAWRTGDASRSPPCLM